MARARFGIAFRLIAGLLATAGFSILASGGGFLSLDEVGRQFSRIALSEIPLLVTASRLSQESQGIAFMAPSFATVDNTFTLATRMGEVNDKLNALDQVIESFGQLGADQQAIRDVRASGDVLRQHFSQLAEVVSQRIGAETSLRKAWSQLVKLGQDIRDRGSALRGRLGPEAPDWGPVIAWSDSAAAILSESLAASGQISKVAAKRLETRLSTLWQQAQGHFDHMSPATQAELRPVHTALGNTITVPPGLTGARLLALEANEAQGGLINKAQILSSRLVIAASDLFVKTQNEVEQRNVAVAAIIEQTSRLLAGAIVLTLVGSGVMLLYINRSVVRRLVGLSTAMTDHAGGRGTEIKVSGNDEVADMSRALAYFVGAIGEREGRLQAVNARLDATSKAIGRLLDASDQGFLSIDDTLVVAPEYSRACEAMLGTVPAGQRFDTLLYPGEDAATVKARGFFVGTIGRALREPDDFRRDMLLSLLPGEVERAGRSLRVTYRPPDGARMMIVLTDLTDERGLERQLLSSHKRLEMVVFAVSDRDAFFDLLDEFEEFLNIDLVDLLAAESVVVDVTVLYRQIHTFKGLFSQFAFEHLPSALHRLESTLQVFLQANTPADRSDFVALFESAGLDLALQQDLSNIQQSLGAEFLAQRGGLLLSEDQVRALSAGVQALMTSHGGWQDDPVLRRLVLQIEALSKVSLRHLIAPYAKVVRRVAERLGKLVAEVEVEGDDVFVDPDRYRPFAKTLVHVFRNAADHGIEAPDQRLLADKPEVARVECRVACQQDGIVLTIADDGRGIDLAALRARAGRALVTAGPMAEGPMVIRPPAGEDVLDLIFIDGVSTAAAPSELSGRGVGLSAVREELERLGGTVVVETVEERGTRFTFHLPLIHTIAPQGARR